METFPLNISEKISEQLAFSICTLVTKKDEYMEMVDSFKKAGFDNNCEFLYIDNTKDNRYDAYSGLNTLISKADGKYIILCHQDILVLEPRDKLEKNIESLSSLDENWAVAGNAGLKGIKKYVRHYINGRGQLDTHGKIPSKVNTLDEHFIILKKDSNISFSINIKGFHFYGTDICLLADIHGYSCYVIDFLIQHKSFGNCDSHFIENKHHLINKYRHAFRSRVIETTCTKIYLSDSRFLNFIANIKFCMWWIKQYYKLTYIIKGNKGY